MLSSEKSFYWTCKHSWIKAAKNTAICLLGCSIGDNLTILGFQIIHPGAHMSIIMLTAMLMGLLTSITLETIILAKQMPIKLAIQVAFGMSFLSMIMMEASANVTSILLAGGNRLMLTWGSILPSWMIGYVSALLYNYYHLKKYGKSCHA